MNRFQNATRIFACYTILPAACLCSAAVYAADVSTAPAGATIEAAIKPDAALERLMAGNSRYVASKSTHPHDSAERRKELKESQHPFAIVLACADSRVSPELVFDQGLGDIFVVRVAGNVADPATLGSISYAVHHLHAPLIVVVGHQSCGAVKAALMPAADLAKEPKEIQTLVEYVEPGIKDVPATLKGDERVKAAVSANVRHSLQQLQAADAVKDAVAEHKLKIVGGVYSLDSGKVDLLP